MSEIPEQPCEVKEVMVWDPVLREYVKGYRRDMVRLPELMEIIWTNKSATNDQAPDMDKEVDVEKAGEIAIQADSTDPDNTSSSIDINVEASLDGSTWDSTPYAEMNIGDAEIKTMLVNPGPKKIRLRLDNNTAASRADVRVLVKVRE